VYHEGDEGFGLGSGRDPDRNEGGFAGRRAGGERDAAFRVNWQSALYAFVLLLACVFLAPLSSLWWVVPLLGVAAPIALAMLGTGPTREERLKARRQSEQQLLEALAERGTLTPTTAAMRTSLTVEEASKMLEALAAEGHLEPRTRDGAASYQLPGHDRSTEPAALPEPDRARPGAVPAEGPDEPLSERELEVLALLASGRTNAEIARDLFVASGTVKSHLNNIYRKLGATNRTGAAARARELDLLR
jgi:DNA-binding NarL/FixJ family response regulator